MSRASSKGAAFEREVARATAGERVTFRPRFEPAPDILPIALPGGELIQIECKRRKRVPAYVTAGLAQCRRYSPDAVPCVAVREDRGEALAVLPLADFVRLVGLGGDDAGSR